MTTTLCHERRRFDRVADWLADGIVMLVEGERINIGKDFSLGMTTARVDCRGCTKLHRPGPAGAIGPNAWWCPVAVS